MLRRFHHAQHRGEAGLGAFEQLAPFVACALLEELRHALALFTPSVPGHARLGVGQGRFSQASALAQRFVELRLQGADGDEFAIEVS